MAETRQADGSCAQIVFRNNAAVDAGDLERLCVKVREGHACRLGAPRINLGSHA